MVRINSWRRNYSVSDSSDWGRHRFSGTIRYRNRRWGGKLKEEDYHPKMSQNLKTVTLHGPLRNYAPLIDEMKVEKVAELIVEPESELDSAAFKESISERIT